MGRGKAGKWCSACKCTRVFCIAKFSEELLSFNISIWKVSLLLSLCSSLRQKVWEIETFLRVTLPCHLPAELEIGHMSRI